MRIVVDTNVFVSAALKESSWPGAVVRWLGGSGGLLKSTVTEAQVITVLQRPYIAPKLPRSYLDTVRQILSRAEMVAIVERIAACRDPTDDRFLELAVNGHADLIVTGDRDLLALGTIRRIPIVTPAAFGHAWAMRFI
jgi:putative PIN family toxin of toxin-antitoxin system